MELIIAVVIMIVTTIVFCKETNEISTTPVTGALASEYWGQVLDGWWGIFITEDELEKMRKKVNSKDSKF